MGESSRTSSRRKKSWWRTCKLPTTACTEPPLRYSFRIVAFSPKKIDLQGPPPVVAAVAHYFMNIHASLQRDHYHHHQQKKSSQYHHLNLLPCRPPIHHSL